MTTAFRSLLLALAGLTISEPIAAIAQSAAEIVKAREKMVQEEIIDAGVKDPRVIDAIRDTPRHEFVPVAQRKFAYLDMALPIGEGQTISPPFVVAYMTEQLDPQPEDKVLEIGTGSGYQAAVLSPLVKEVYSIEIVEPLGTRAAATLRRLKYKNVFTKVGDGYLGWPEHAPFDKIIVTCSPENVPQPLVDQLKEGGQMVIPLGERYQQSLYLYRKVEGKLEAEALLPTLFVPMTGAAEERRARLPDPTNPELVNGGFEKSVAGGNAPASWHYQRQMKHVAAADAPEGARYVTFTNAEAGRGSHALQAFAVDGRTVREIEVSVWVNGKGIRQGQSRAELPGVAITWYDQRRKGTDPAFLGGWRGTFDWQQETTRFVVPADAREAIVRIGLHGAVGQVSFDDISIRVVKRE
jgi:protein-L-isoaspartate(D-aspartate) O-methyltransferase